MSEQIFQFWMRLNLTANMANASISELTDVFYTSLLIVPRDISAAILSFYNNIGSGNGIGVSRVAMSAIKEFHGFRLPSKSLELCLDLRRVPSGYFPTSVSVFGNWDERFVFCLYKSLHFLFFLSRGEGQILLSPVPISRSQRHEPSLDSRDRDFR